MVIFSYILTCYGVVWFSGDFDGNNHIISNLYVNKPTNYCGLFGYMDSVEVRNLGLINVSLTCARFGGAISGRFAATLGRNLIENS